MTEKELKKKNAFKGKMLPFEQAAPFYFKRAERYADKNNYYDALAYYRKAYEKEPDDSDYALAYASMLTEMGCFDESNLVIFDMLLKDQMESECFYGLGCNFLGLQELERSEECLQKYIQMDPDGEFIEDVEEMLFMFKASKWLPENFSSLNSIFSSEGMEDADKGKHALDMGEYKKAIFFLTKAINRNPELTFAKNNLSIAYYCNNNLEQAIKITGGILENEPNNVHACCNMAIYCGEKKDEAGLQSAIEHILELDYDNADDLQKAAVTLCELGMHQQAEKMLTELIEYKPYDKKLLHYLAVSKFNQGAYMEAELHWANILKIDPQNTIAPYYLALSRECRQKPPDQPRILSYYFQVPYDETLKRLRIMGQYYEKDAPSEIVKEEQLSLLLWGLELNDVDMKRRILTLIAGAGTQSAQRALRQFIMKRNESDNLKKEVFVLLRAMGAKEPYIAYIDNKLSEININVTNSADDAVQSAIVSLIKTMMEEDDVQKLELTMKVWEAFIQANPETKLNNPEAWGAALEYYASNKYGERMLKKTVCKKYGVSLSALNRRLDILKSGLEEKSKINIEEQPMKMLATSAFGLEALVAEELKAIGIQNTRAMDARIFFEGGMQELYEANLWLRCADRVFVIVGSFSATSFDDLYEGVKSLPWEQYLPRNARFPVKGKSALSKLRSVSDCQSVTKKAIVDRLKQRHRIEILDESGPEVIVEVAMLKDTATLCLDASGAGLNRRGYRSRQAEAPLRETLAAALVKLARYRPGRMMWDPFCGSGTIAIEAAMIAQNIAPGWMRSFACEQWPFMPEGIIQTAREKAVSLRTKTGMEIMATDIDERAVKIARQNAQNAGVSDAMHIQRMDVSDIRTKVKNGLFICNPPYGQRMLEQKSARALYATAGQVMRSLDGWQSFIITSDGEFERYFGKRADRKRKLYNGSTQCTFYQYYKR